MTWESVIRDVLVWGSAFAVGSALFTAALCLRMVRVNPRRYLSFAAAKVGYAITASIVLLRILLPNPDITPDLYAWGYAFGLGLAGVGFVGVGRAIRREYVEYEVDGGRSRQQERLELLNEKVDTHIAHFDEFEQEHRVEIERLHQEHGE